MIEKKNPTVLMILDGWGVAPAGPGNAVSQAQTPAFDRLAQTYPYTTLGATGKDVGLENNKRSGSEAGHLNIGAGRIVKQDSSYITESIQNKNFFHNEELLGAMEHVKKFGGNLHLIGLMGNSDSPHSDPDHFRALLQMAKSNGIKEAYCHFFTDGRDSYPKSALENLAHFRKIMSEEGIGKIATVGGRFYGMDRAKNWNRIVLAYEAMVFVKGKAARSAEEAIEDAYRENLTDEFVKPTVIMEKEKPVAKIQKDDAVIFFNLRSDRARQFTKLFVSNNREKIIRENMLVLDKIANLFFVAMTSFGPDLDIHTAFPENEVSQTLPMVLNNFKQLYIAEGEKYAHVTYFFNGGHDRSLGGEDRVTIQSPITEHLEDCPEMSAGKIGEFVLEALKKKSYDFITVNFANADMLGHTGNFSATVKAIEFIDQQIGLIADEVLSQGGHLIITADHGNADNMKDENSDQPNTFHTKNPVPFILVSDRYKDRELRNYGVLANIAPTILEILGVEKPSLMNQESLLK